MPIVELRFPNVLQTSVQVGDVAYFSNPVAVPDANIPGQNYEWEATHTPHMTNARSEIKMIGEIISIDTYVYTAQPGPSIRSHITVDGVPPVQNAGVIRCDMPQDLFNKYWDEVKQGQCESIVDPNAAVITGDCADYTHAYDHPVIIEDLNNQAYQNQFLSNRPESPLGYLFNNPNTSAYETLFHVANGTIDGTQTPHCEVPLNSKSINGVDDYVVGKFNYWSQYEGSFINVVNPVGTSSEIPFVTGQQSGGTSPYGSTPAGYVTVTSGIFLAYIAFRAYPSYWPSTAASPAILSANGIIDKLNEIYPNGNYSYGMSVQQFFNHHRDYMLTYKQQFPELFDPSHPDVINAGYANQILDQMQNQNCNWWEINKYMYEAPRYNYMGNPIQNVSTYTPSFTTNCEEPSFIMFSKDNKANMSSLLGYYASAEFRNNSTDKAELFNVGTVFTESSK